MEETTIHVDFKLPVIKCQNCGMEFSSIGYYRNEENKRDGWVLQVVNEGSEFHCIYCGFDMGRSKKEPDIHTLSDLNLGDLKIGD